MGRLGSGPKSGARVVRDFVQKQALRAGIWAKIGVLSELRWVRKLIVRVPNALGAFKISFRG